MDLCRSQQQAIRVGPFFLGKDNPKIGLHLNDMDYCYLVKATATGAVVSMSTRQWADLPSAPGWYTIILTGQDTNTVGELILFFCHKFMDNAVILRYRVLSQGAYEARYGQNCYLQDSIPWLA